MVCCIYLTVMILWYFSHIIILQHTCTHIGMFNYIYNKLFSEIDFINHYLYQEVMCSSASDCYFSKITKQPFDWFSQHLVARWAMKETITMHGRMLPVVCLTLTILPHQWSWWRNVLYWVSFNLNTAPTYNIRQQSNIQHHSWVHRHHVTDGIHSMTWWKTTSQICILHYGKQLDFCF